ncbi:MAG: 3-oxoacyl-[acyl-carrier-protein] reductase [Methanosarcinales archaeon]
MRLNDKVALVTGSSRGIGRSIALALAEEGADVAINYQAREVPAKEVAQQIEDMGRSSGIYKANVGNFEQVNKMISDITENFGKIDILVNNAGINRDKTLAKMDQKMWNEVISVNLNSVFNCTRAVINGMIERKYGRIVNISSVVGLMGNIGQSNYAASKAGVIGFTKTLAKEVARKGITVNAIAPGFIATDMLASIPEKIMDKIIDSIPLGRLGQPEEVAKAVVYLVSDDGAYITGQVLSINGGLYI